MILTLEVVSPRASSLGTAGRQSFGVEGGTIGRARGSDWILPHSKVSNRHARITCANGAFYIEDTSTNGVYLNDSRERLVRGRPQRLRTGDRLLIEPYEIRVTVTASAGARGPAIDDGRLLADDPPEAAIPGRPPREGNVAEVDPLKLLGGSPPAAPPRRPPAARDLGGESPLAAHYRPPTPPTPAPSPWPQPPEAVPIIPEDYDPLASDSDLFAPPRGTPPPVVPPPAVPPPAAPPPQEQPPVLDPFADFELAPPAAPPPLAPPAAAPPEAVPVRADEIPTPTPVAAPPLDPAPVDAPPPREPARRTPPPWPPAAEPRRADAHDGLAAMLAGAGFEGVEITEELAADFGRILRVVVTGVMDVLRARQQIKDEFRMRMTQFRPADNNPLKFSANVDDALHNLLVKRNPAYLPAVRAFEDAFDDVRAHQVAMLAGMRVAFDAMFRQFAPDRLQAQFDRQLKKGALLAVPAKLRYWELYREWCEALLADPDDTFRTLFGEDFARAYEEQLARLKAERRGTPPPER